MEQYKVLEMIPLLGNGGMENIVYSWLEILKCKLGTKIHFDIVTVSILDENKASEFRKLGCHIFVIPLRQRYVIKRYFIYKKIMQKKQYKAVHLHTSCAMDFSFLLAAQSCNIPIRIAHSHNSDIGNNNKAARLMQYLAFPIFNYLCTMRLSCSDLAGKHLFGSYPYTLFRNSVDTGRFLFNVTSRDQIRKKYSIEADSLVIGHVGNFRYQKNHQKIIDVFCEIHKKVPNSRLFLIGSGELEEQIKSNVARYNLSDQVIFTGNIYDVEDYYSAMDVFLLPSHYEGFSIAVIEAQCNGLNCLIAENLSEDMVITDRTYRVSLDEPASKWAEIAIRSATEHADNREMYSQTVRNKGYDTFDNGVVLGKYYGI